MAAVPVPVPKCRCAKPLPTLRRTCKSNKNGNQGRTYFSCCITNRKDKCNFFKWEDELQREVNAIVQERTGLHVRVPTPEVTTSPLITKASDPKIQAAKERRSNLTDTSKWACQRPAPHPNSLEAVSLASASTTSKVSRRNGGEGGGQGPFACNQKIANFLNDLSKAHAEGDNNPTDKWRTYNYKKASQVVQNFSLPLDKDNEENFQALGKHRGIGQKTMQKIREYAVTGKSTRLEAFKKDETRQAMSVISKVWGLGTKTAKILVNQGIKTIEDLRREFREGRVSLTDQQVIGLRVYEDLLKPIDRADIAKIGETVRKAVNELCPGTDLDIMGSYRRGALSGHDVDCLITNEKFVDNTPRNILEQLVVKLEKEGFMTDHLSMPNREKRFADQYDRSRWYKGESEDKFGSEEHALTKGVEKLPGINKNRDKQSYMGVCQLNGVHKRIDIKFYPRHQLPFAQLYFTGNAYFNRSMRLYAKTVGYSLSDDGLFETMRKRINGESHVVSQGPSLPAKTEEDIFKLMGLVYVAPKDRNAYDAVVTAKLDGLDVEKEELSQDVRELEFDGDLGGSQSFWAEEGRQGKALEGSECDSDFGDFWNDNAKYQYANPEA
jgi:DNA polymerase/3'-5' exonuclease PolX